MRLDAERSSTYRIFAEYRADRPALQLEKRAGTGARWAVTTPAAGSAAMTKKKRLSLRVALLRWSDHPLMLNFYRMTRWLRQSLGMLSTTSFHYQPHLLQPATAKPRNKMHKKRQQRACQHWE